MAADEEGLTVREAMQQIADSIPEDLRSDVQLFAGGITYVDEEYDERLRGPLLDRLTDALLAGSRYAEGYKEPVTPKDEPVPVPGPLWRVLVPDPDNDTAEGGGLRYSGLRIYETKPVTVPLKENVDAVYLKRVADMIAEKGRPPTIDEDEKWASRVLRSRNRVRDLRKKHGTAKRRGTPKS